MGPWVERAVVFLGGYGGELGRASGGIEADFNVGCFQVQEVGPRERGGSPGFQEKEGEVFERSHSLVEEFFEQASFRIKGFWFPVLGFWLNPEPGTRNHEPGTFLQELSHEVGDLEQEVKNLARPENLWVETKLFHGSRMDFLRHGSGVPWLLQRAAPSQF